MSSNIRPMTWVARETERLRVEAAIDFVAVVHEREQLVAGQCTGHGVGDTLLRGDALVGRQHVAL
jgi:hypothetical protein